MSLAACGNSKARQNEAHTDVGRIYGWFTEGFDTEDLQEAKGLIEELGD